MGKYYDNSIIPKHLRRNFDVYERINKLGIDLGKENDWLTDLKNSAIASVVFHESGTTYLSGLGLGPGQMNDSKEKIKYGKEAGRKITDSMIARLHWALICGEEGGDLNDVLYTVKALGMVVSTDVDFNSAPEVVNGFSSRWQSIFGGGIGEFSKNGEDENYSGVHARSAIGGFTGRFSLEPEIIIAIPPELSKRIIQNRGWIFPLPPKELARIKK